eukprot:3969191-Alexandrium_andersonii.AAC.1
MCGSNHTGPRGRWDRTSPPCSCRSQVEGIPFLDAPCTCKSACHVVPGAAERSHGMCSQTVPRMPHA